MDGRTAAGTEVKKRNPIYVEDFIDVARPFEELRPRFNGDGQWLEPLATMATQDGETIRMRIGPSWAAGLITRQVNVTLWPPRARDDALARSVTWVPVEWQSLFPLLDGDIELAPLGPECSRLSLAVAYTPSMGGFGVQVDRTLLHRVAASTVRSFLVQVAEGLQTSVE